MVQSAENFHPFLTAYSWLESYTGPKQTTTICNTGTRSSLYTSAKPLKSLRSRPRRRSPCWSKRARRRRSRLPVTWPIQSTTARRSSSTASQEILERGNPCSCSASSRNTKPESCCCSSKDSKAIGLVMYSCHLRHKGCPSADHRVKVKDQFLSSGRKLQDRDY